MADSIAGIGQPRRLAAALLLGMFAILAAGAAPAGAGAAAGAGAGAQTGAPTAKPAAGSAVQRSDTVDDREQQAHRNQDIDRHRTMAAAHDAAARCLAAGRSEKECHDALRDACKGIAVGRYCGMRHSH